MTVFWKSCKSEIGPLLQCRKTTNIYWVFAGAFPKEKKVYWFLGALANDLSTGL